jgi:twitching motility two-component system response regulator PilG
MIDGQQNITASAPPAERAQHVAVIELPKLRLLGLKIMVIDDSRTIRRSAELMLAQSGCEVILAEDGFDALQKIFIHSPDIIFVDVLMPRLDGYKTCSLIKRSTVHKHIPVIMLTSKDSLFDRARGLAAGSSQYLTKPFTKENLLRTVEAHNLVGSAPVVALHS